MPGTGSQGVIDWPVLVDICLVTFEHRSREIFLSFQHGYDVDLSVCGLEKNWGLKMRMQRPVIINCFSFALGHSKNV